MAKLSHETNQTLHAVKRLIAMVVFVVLLILCMPRYERLISLLAVFILLVNLPFYVHRRLARRLLAADGFQLVTFNEHTGFVSWSFDWPWWCEHYGYWGTVASTSAETLDFYVSLEGPLFALISPKVGTYDIENQVADSGPRECAEIFLHLRSLQVLRSLRRLDLSYSDVTDIDLQCLREFESLELLDLTYTGVTDIGLEHLKHLPTLSELDLQDTQTTPEGRAMLRATLTECDIYPDP